MPCTDLTFSTLPSPWQKVQFSVTVALAKAHMQDPFNGANFSATQATINATVTENCTFCHGDGKVLNVKSVHGIP